MTTNKNIYHEKQCRELCALHCLNSLFQNRGTFTKTELDAICNDLSPNLWINPHKSVLGLGNYDINVIMSCLQQKNYDTIWFDKRKDPKIIDNTKIFGFILNVPSDYKIGFVTLPLKRRHWIAIRKIDDQYYNLDSKLDHPLCLGYEDELLAYLRSQLQSNDKELFVVVHKDVEKDQGWILNNNHEV